MELETLPEFDINLEVKNEHQETIPEPVVHVNLKEIIIKKQTVAALWHQPEQEFTLLRQSFDAEHMELLDAFIEKNIPAEEHIKKPALAFIESVLLGNTTERASRVFYNDGKHLSFQIFFN